jgi:hypothetical protein
LSTSIGGSMVSAMTMIDPHGDLSPTCYAAVRDASLRAALRESLEPLGWRVIHRDTGFHLVGELADVILEGAPPRRPTLLVLDEPAAGCRASSIAEGLDALGIPLPVAVVASDDGAERAPAPQLYVIEPKQAAARIRELASSVAPRTEGLAPSGVRT